MRKTESLISRRAIRSTAAAWRRKGLRIVFTNGVFDILHRGHIELLEKAKSWGGVLVVGMNSDSSTKRLKGPRRPINSQTDRARVLGALKTVDHVCIFAEDTPLNLILALRPDVLVKGSEYRTGEIVGAAEVKSWGGTVRRFTMRPGFSTSAIERRILASPVSGSRRKR